MATYTVKNLSDEGEDQRLLLVGVIADLEASGLDVPDPLRVSATKKQLSIDTLTAAIIELTGRVVIAESAISSLTSRVTALEVFHP